MTDDDIKIPGRFWETVDAEEFHRVMERGGLDAEQCARLWRMTERQDAPPPFLAIYAKREDVLRIWPPHDPPPSRQARRRQARKGR